MSKFNPLLLNKMEVFKYNQLLTFCEEKNEKGALNMIVSNSIIEYVFCCACYNGKLDIVQFILNIYPSINVSSKNEYAFRVALIKNHIDICKWLLQFNSKINLDVIRGIINEKFWEFCIEGNKENAEWLFCIYPGIKKCINHCLYIMVCSNDRIDVAKWINTVKPYYFILELNNDESKILKYSIRKVSERKWLERRIPVLAHNCNNDNIFKCVPYDIIRYICMFV